MKLIIIKNVAIVVVRHIDAAAEMPTLINNSTLMNDLQHDVKFRRFFY